MTLEQAIASALAPGTQPGRDNAAQHTVLLTPPAGAPPAGADGAHVALTLREREVAVHIAQGESNQGIGAALGISERTVERHVAKIFAKLGVRSRARIAAWAVACGLTRAAP